MKIQRTRNVKLPTRGTSGSAGLDFYMPNDVAYHEIRPGQSVLIPSGIKVDIPKDHVLIAFNKSGISYKRNLLVGACVVDEDYQGEIHIHLFNVGSRIQIVTPGEKLIQFVLLPVVKTEIEEVDNIHPELSERGTGGFGSTGGGGLKSNVL